jgi:hypothetical protein
MTALRTGLKGKACGHPLMNNYSYIFHPRPSGLVICTSMANNYDTGQLKWWYHPRNIANLLYQHFLFD